MIANNYYRDGYDFEKDTEMLKEVDNFLKSRRLTPFDLIDEGDDVWHVFIVDNTSGEGFWFYIKVESPLTDKNTLFSGDFVEMYFSKNNTREMARKKIMEDEEFHKECMDIAAHAVWEALREKINKVD